MRVLCLFLLASFCASCVNTQKLNTYWIPKNQKIYENKNDKVDGETYTYLYTYDLKKGILATVKPNEEKHELEITFRSVAEDDITISRKLGDADLKIKEYKYFPYNDASKNPRSYYTVGDKFVYWESSPVFQAITIPIKLRPALGERKSTASGSFNVGFSYGRKFTRNVYRNFYNKEDKGVLNSNIRRFTIVPGVFFGPTLIDLDAGNTDNAVTSDRTVIGSTVGAMGVVGLNQVNLGLAVGFDTTYGSEPSDWVYRNKPWIGIVVSFDFFK